MPPFDVKIGVAVPIREFDSLRCYADDVAAFGLRLRAVEETLRLRAPDPTRVAWLVWDVDHAGKVITLWSAMDPDLQRCTLPYNVVCELADSCDTQEIISAAKRFIARNITAFKETPHGHN